MTKRIFRSILGAALAVLLVSLVFVVGFLYDYFDGVQASQLETELELAARGMERAGTAYLEGLKAEDYRVTLVAPDGTVLYDSQADPAGMENHRDREEIRGALETGRGSGSRYSATLMRQTLYRACLLSNGDVLRLSSSRATLAGVVLSMAQPIAVLFILAVGLSVFLAHRMAKRVVEPLNRLDLEHPLENDAYEELFPLLRRIGDQHRQIDQQMEELCQRTREFRQITQSMREALVLLDKSGKILGINPAAQALFGAEGDCLGKDFLTLDRRQDVRRALETALEKGHCGVRAQRNGREYQFDCSRVESDAEIYGVALLAFDVTEQAFAERNRREFTANASHELKTPVQSILGYAELLQSGLAKPEDEGRFLESIHREASRLVTLIEDIIRLSQLDEGGALPCETVDLLALAEEEVKALENAAAEKRVSVSVEGSAVELAGPRQLYREIVHNLCDNAVKYNREGGSVTVAVRPWRDGAGLTVADTGIGIPPEHQGRVFERFYRVDKSRSKETGGTGLGLSIVKHAVRELGGEITLESEPGRGTVVTAHFPGGSR